MSDIVLASDIRMKLCRKCGRTLPASRDFFYAHNASRDRLHCWCKRCLCLYTTGRQKAWPEAKKAVRRAYQHDRLDQARGCRALKRASADAVIAAELARHGGCATCGDTTSHRIHWHHVSGAGKADNISRLRDRGCIEKLVAELAKCVPLCANHHLDLHHESTRGGA